VTLTARYCGCCVEAGEDEKKAARQRGPFVLQTGVLSLAARRREVMTYGRFEAGGVALAGGAADFVGAFVAMALLVGVDEVTTPEELFDAAPEAPLAPALALYCAWGMFDPEPCA
jgi:hypothetical protein